MPYEARVCILFVSLTSVGGNGAMPWYESSLTRLTFEGILGYARPQRGSRIVTDNASITPNLW